MNLANLLSGALGAALVALIDFLFLKKQDKLEDRVKTLETEKVDKLAEKFEKHVDSDQSQRIAAILETISGRLAKIEDSVQRALESNASQESRLVSVERAINNHEKNYHRNKQ